MLSRNGTAWTADRVLSERPCLPDSPGTECSMLYGAFGQLIWPSRNLEIYPTGRIDQSAAIPPPGRCSGFHTCLLALTAARICNF